MTTMREAYDEQDELGNHMCCDDCELCVDCGDCECDTNTIKGFGHALLYSIIIWLILLGIVSISILIWG
jgi:hypothetical protein